MRVVERAFGTVGVDPNGPGKRRAERLPGRLVDVALRLDLQRIRRGMGGTSRDVTRRPISVEDRQIRGSVGEVRIRIYAPGTSGRRPAVLFHHGGGWFGGSVAAVEEFCKGVADQGDAVVISVDYHLAPRYRFPVAVEDSYRALLWTVDHAGEIGIDPSRITVAGDSAGGNIAAVLTIMANDRREVEIDGQILIYPALDNRLEHMHANFPESHKAMAATVRLYLGRRQRSDHPYVSPITYDRLGALPSALIAVGGLDDLYGTAWAYGEALADAGVAVDFITYRNASHAFIDDTGYDPNAGDLVAEAARFINRRVAPPGE
jgi:acetyl esterase/lipase